MKKKLFALTLTIFLVGALLSQIDIRQFGQFVREFSISGLALAFVVYTISYFFRALRWKQLIHTKKIGLGELMMVSSAHIMFNNLMPSRSGELSYIYLLKKRHGISGSEGLATLLVARLYDFAMLACYFLVSVFFFWRTTSMTIQEITAGSIVLLGTAVILIFNLNRFVQWGLNLFQKGAVLFHFEHTKIARFVFEKGGETIKSFAAIRSMKKFMALGFSSFFIWGFKFLSFYIIMQAILTSHIADGLVVSFWMVVLGTTAAELTTILPVHGVGGFGTYESAWAGAYYLLGFSKALAIKTAFSFHLLGLLFSVILGVSSLVLLRLFKSSPLPSPVVNKPIEETTLVGR